MNETLTQSLHSHLEAIRRELSRQRQSLIKGDHYSSWLKSPLTRLFMLELKEQYLENVLDEPVVKAHLERVGGDAALMHTNPVEETAINSAVKSGRDQVFKAVLEWQPINMEKENDAED